jgi:N-acetylglucosamine kinase-like BadF-type ATPase
MGKIDSLLTVCLGIDGGGSKTTLLLADDLGHEISCVHSGPSNWLSVGPDAAAAAIREGVYKLKGPPPDVVCGGFAGAGRNDGLEFYRSVLSSVFPKAHVRIETDAFIAYVGALGLKPGVLLIAGTGSIAIGRKADGTMIRVGGWGPHFGDEGSGFWIGREAVRAALRSMESGSNPALGNKIAAKLGLDSIKDAVAAWSAGKVGVPEIASLAPIVIESSMQEPASHIVTEAASYLRSLAESAIAQVGVPDCTVSAIGSIVRNPIMMSLIGKKFADPLAPPERGAVMLACNGHL